MMTDALYAALKKLRLSGVLETLDLRLQEAVSSSLTHQEFLELILEDELSVREDRAFGRRLRAAAFRDLKTLEDFDWRFNPTINKRAMYDLASGRFVHEKRDVLFCGPPGVGKSHLVQAVGYALVKSGHLVWYRSIFDAVHELKHDEAFEDHEKIMSKYLKPDVLILDDMGMKQLPPRSGEYLFEIIMRRYERKSTMMTTNRPLEDWGKLLGDTASATAILDRLIHHADVVTITGESYRLKDRGRGGESLSSKKTRSQKDSSKESSSKEKEIKTGQSAHRRKGAKKDPKKDAE